MNFFRFGQILFNLARTLAVRIMKEALFLHFLGSLLNTFLITLRLGKEIQGYYYYCFVKMSGLKK